MARHPQAQGRAVYPGPSTLDRLPWTVYPGPPALPPTRLPCTQPSTLCRTARPPTKSPLPERLPCTARPPADPSTLHPPTRLPCTP